MRAEDKVKVECDQAGCLLPAAYLKDGVLIITSHHHGEKHTTTLNLQTIPAEPIDKLKKMAL